MADEEEWAPGFDTPLVSVRVSVENATHFVEIVAEDVKARESAAVSRYFLAQLPPLPRARKRSTVTPASDAPRPGERTP